MPSAMAAVPSKALALNVHRTCKGFGKSESAIPVWVALPRNTGQSAAMGILAKRGTKTTVPRATRTVHFMTNPFGSALWRQVSNLPDAAKSKVYANLAWPTHSLHCYRSQQG